MSLLLLLYLWFYCLIAEAISTVTVNSVMSMLLDHRSPPQSYMVKLCCSSGVGLDGHQGPAAGWLGSAGIESPHHGGDGAVIELCAPAPVLVKLVPGSGGGRHRTCFKV